MSSPEFKSSAKAGARERSSASSVPVPPPTPSSRKVHTPPASGAVQTGLSGASPPASKAAASASGPVPAFYSRRKKRGNEICQLLIRAGDVDPVHVRAALKLQEERGGQVGQILIQLGACTEDAIARALLQQVQLRAAEGQGNASTAARANPALVGLKVECSPWRTRATIVASDTMALGAAVLAGVLVGGLRHGAWWDPIELMAPVTALCLLLFWVFDLYAAMAKSPADELRNTTVAITVVVVGLATFALARHGLVPWGLTELTTCWLCAAPTVPIARSIVRGRLARKSWWGHPVVVLGAGKTARALVRALKAQPWCGLKPVMMLDDDTKTHGTLRASVKNDAVEVGSVMATNVVSDSFRKMASDLLSASGEHASASTTTKAAVAASSDAALAGGSGRGSIPDGDAPPSSVGPDSISGPPSTMSGPASAASGARARGMFAEVSGVPVVGELALAPLLARRLRIPYAILAMPGVSSQRLVQLTERVGGMFSHVLVIPDLFGFATLGVPAKEVGGMLGIEVRQQLLLPGPRFAKRAMDIVLTLLGGLFVLPILSIMAIAIKLDSAGPVLYFQKRLGRDGRHFMAAKFRTMHGDGEARLKSVLENDAALRAEYEEFHKLTNDPRVTRFGRILRKYSLDELPQLWNVLRGEMSLVGPRPYIEREIPDMGQQEGIILRAMPGMTGMWQVSDRNATGFAQRVKMDVHYVRNWSPWLDVYVLARTLGVVLRGTGI